MKIYFENFLLITIFSKQSLAESSSKREGNSLVGSNSSMSRLTRSQALNPNKVFTISKLLSLY